MKDFLKRFGQVTAVIGAQWGDEGKGKIIDLLAAEYGIVARACGGANAGHTIVVEGKKHVFRLLPSGCLQENAQIVLGAGMVIHLPTLLEEIDLLKGVGIDIVPRLRIAKGAHILFDFHKAIDSALEERREKVAGKGIGTTKRGIGPAYMDKAERIGIRMERLGEDLTIDLSSRAKQVQASYGIPIDVQSEVSAINEASERISSAVCDTTDFLNAAIERNQSVLIEGAQATLLDIDHGTYPYVTSSSTTLAGALQGLGIAPRHVTSCIGVAKAYCTRVGSGDFPAEAEGETAQRLRDRGGEYGSVTGRPRRTGWLSIDDLRFSARLNGFTHWNITKLDVLDTEDSIPVYRNGMLERLPGWATSTAGISRWNDLPGNAKTYIERIEKETKITVSCVGTGQNRNDMIVLSHTLSPL